MDSVDKLTLELFTNKAQYKKYLSKNDPEKYHILQEKRERYEKYKNNILEKTEQLLSFPNMSVSSLIEETFENYVDVIIKEIETNALVIKDLEHEHSFSDEDEDVLFKHCNDSSKLHQPSPILREYEYKEKKTFWNHENETKMNYEGIFNHYPTNSSIRKRFIGRRNSILP
jgi:hypothetical protein